MSGLGDKIKVERLDSARLARIEESVLAARELPEARIERPGWFRLAPLAAAACALVLVAGALGYWLHRSGGAVASGTAPVPAITTGPGEAATVAVGDAIVTMAENSQVSFRTRADGRIDVDLERGRVDCDVTPRPNRPVFAVHAADVDVAVVGTAFSVSRSGQAVQVTVTRGKVSVTRGGKQMYVAAGENWPAGTTVAAAEPDPDRASEPDREPDRVPEPDPDPGAEHLHQKTGRREQGTGDREQGTQKSSSKVALPTGLPPLHACAPDASLCATNGMKTGQEHALELYTAIYLEVANGNFKAALVHADLYDKRFQRRRPGEAAAVKQLRRIAGGE